MISWLKYDLYWSDLMALGHWLVLYARRDAAISDIGLAHDTVANKISELRGLLKANSQLDVLNAECAAVLRGGGVICTHCTENNNVICDERATRTLFIASNGGYPQNSLHGEA